MEVSPVGRCNHRCIFCAYDFIGYPNRRLDTKKMLSFIRQAASCGLKSILFAGEGEPLLHPDIARLVKFSKQCGIDVGMFTNGQFLNRDLAAEILACLTFVRFSFNAGSPENYAAIHGVKKEVFATVLDNIKNSCEIKRMKRLKLDIGIQFVLIPENIRYLLAAVRETKKRGVDYFAIKPFVHQSRLQNYKPKKFSAISLRRSLDAAEKLSTKNFSVIARRQSFCEYGKRGYRHCYGTSFISTLNSAGDIAACLPHWDKKEFVFGNIYKDSFADIWKGPRRKRIKSLLEKRLDVSRCPPNCRPHQINEFLWEIKNPKVRHINFI